MATTLTRLTNIGDYYTSANLDEVTGAVVTNGLVAYLDAGNPASYRGTGTNITDLSNINVNATLNGNVSWVNSGTASYFNFPVAGDLNYITSNISQAYRDITIVFQPDFTLSTGAQLSGLIAINTNTSTYDKSLRLRNVNGVGPWYITGNVDANDWNSTTTNTSSYYLNGTSTGILSTTTNVPVSSGWNVLGVTETNMAYFPNTFPYVIGASGYPGRGFQGKIAAVLLYNRPLTQAEQFQNYNYFAGRYGLTPIAKPASKSITTSAVFFNQLDELASTENTASVVTSGLQLNLDASIGYPGTGNKWFDISGNNSTATLFSNAGGYPNTAGLSYDARYKGSIYFPATTSSYIQFYAPNMGNTATVEMWANLGTNYAGGMIMGWNGYDVWCSGGAIGFNTNNSDQYGITSTQVQNLNLVGNWKQYVFVMNSATSLTLTNAIYINGVNQALTAISANPESPGARNFNGGNGAIGSYLSNGGTGFNENMYNAVFRVYNRQLSQTEITQNYNAIAPRFKLPTVGIPVVGLKESATAVIPAGVFDEVSGIVNSNGLAINLDATNYNSYNGTGTVWHNLASLGVDTAMVTAGGGIPWSNTYTGAFLINGTTSTGYFPVYAASQGSLGSTATVELWANIQAFSGGMLFGWQGYNIWTNSGAMGYNTFASDQYGISAAQVTSLGLLNNWKHYVFVMNTSSYLTNQIWVNGVSQTLSQISGTLNAGSCNFNPPYIQIPGNYSSINYLMPLNLGLFRVYNRGLSPAEIVDNFNSKRSIYGV